MDFELWEIGSFTLRLSLGVFLALLWLWLDAPRRGFDRRQLTGKLWLIAGGALVAGRLGYVAVRSRYFAARPADIFALHRVGGLQGAGAWAGGLLVCVLMIGKTRRRSLAGLSLLMTAALFVASGAWWGCADAGCAWGEKAFTSPPWLRWLVVDAPDLYHTLRPRYAVQTVAALSALLAGGLSIVWSRFGLFWGAGYLLSVAVLGTLRADPMLMVGGFRLDGWIYLGLALVLSVLQIRRERMTEVASPEI